MPHADPAVRRAYGREWIKRNAAKAREAMSRWRTAHREEDRANKRDYYARNRARSKAAVAAYRLANPEVVRVVRRLRRAREVAAAGVYTTAQWLDLVRVYDGRCGYCGLAVTLEPDHRVPLARGGSNWIENIIPCCRPCNTRKRTATEDEFRARLLREGRVVRPTIDR
ncbi:MAG: HNH endonuclease [Chloroflexi bacterium]|nr:MAG: HNH endonuclease [Chloroflexota bacterium]